MKIRDSTFFGLLIASFFLIVVLHIAIKNLLKEPIFRMSQPMIAKTEVDTTEVELPGGDIKNSITQIKNQPQNEAAIKGANFYSPYHESDLHNEETDLSKYFQINPSIYDVTAVTKQMQCNGPVGSGVCKNPVKPAMDKLTGNPMYFDPTSQGSLAFKPDIWAYDNERPMNGGTFDGIRGQDTLQSDYAIFPSNAHVSAQGFQNAYPYTQSSGDW